MLSNIRKRNKTRWVVVFTLICFLMNMVPLGYLAEAEASHASRWYTGAQTGTTNSSPDPSSRSEGDNSPPDNPTEGAEPVNFFNGNFTYSHVDFSIPARGLPLTVVHEYSAQTTYNGPYGYGWSINYDISLSVFSDTTLLVRKGLENQRRYTLSETPGEYDPPSGVHERLVKNTDDTFKLTKKHGTAYEFDTQGNLTAIRDRNGNQLSVHYSQEKFAVTGLLYDSDNEGDVVLRHRITEIEDATGRKITFTYNDTGRLVKITDFTGREFSYEYDNDGNLIKITNPMNYSKQFSYEDHNFTAMTYYNDATILTNTYDDEDRVIAQEYLGDSYTFEYDTENLKTIVVDPLVTTTVYEMNAVGNPLKITVDPDGLNLITEKTYDASMNMTSEKDPRGYVTGYSYDDRGNLESVTDPLSNVSAYEYEPVFNQVALSTDFKGNEIICHYDTNGNLTYLKDRGGYETRYEYNDFGQVTKEINPLEKETLFEYYADTGYLKSIKNPLNHITEYSYDSRGNLISIKDANNHTTDFEYDDLNRITKQTDTLKNETLYDYDTDNNLIQITNARGAITKFEYNNYDYLVKKIEAFGTPIQKETGFEYGPLGSLIKEIGPENHETTHEYDKLNRLVKIVNHKGYHEDYEYDISGNRVKVTDANLKVMQYEYDELNRLKKVIDALNGETLYGYDENGNMISITDANENTTSLSCNSRDLLEEIVDPIGRKVSFAYNGLRSVETRVDGNMVTTSYKYDDAGRLWTVTYPGPRTVTYDVDPVGNVRLASDSETGVTNTYTYDELDRIRITGQLGRTIEYQYDEVKNRKQMKITGQGFPAEGRAVAYDWDFLNRLTDVNDGGQIVTIGYTPIGMRSSTILPNGCKIEYAYDELYRLLSIINKKDDGTVLSSYSYTYDNTINRLTMTDHDSMITSYQYDNLYQLEKVTNDSGTVTYDYDPVGNRITMTNAVGSTAYSYDDANQLTGLNSPAGTMTFAHDSNGNLTSKTVGTDIASYTYGPENRLIGITYPDSSTNSFLYDPNGKRMERTAGGKSVKYLYDGWNVAAEIDVTDAVKQTYVSGITVDDVFGMSQGESFYCYFKDGLGSVTGITDSTQNVVAGYTYDAHGNATKVTGSVDNEITYTGRRLDSASGLMYYRTRYYEPTVGRFLTKDSFQPNYYTPLTLHRYMYVLNNPVNWTDPLGLINLKRVAWGGVQVVGGGLGVVAGVGVGVGAGWTGVGAVAGGVCVVTGASTGWNGLEDIYYGLQDSEAESRTGLQRITGGIYELAAGENATECGLRDIENVTLITESILGLGASLYSAAHSGLRLVDVTRRGGGTSSQFMGYLPTNSGRFGFISNSNAYLQISSHISAGILNAIGLGTGIGNFYQFN